MLNGVASAVRTTSGLRPQEKLAQYPFVYIAPTQSCGLGLFTARPRASGDIAVRVRDPNYLREWRSHAEAHALGFGHMDIFQVGEDKFLLPFGGLDDFTNHSCEPNCGLRVFSDGFDMVALRDIAVPEELTYDYSTHQEHPEEDMPCRCGTLSCRGVIRSFSTLPAALRKYYLDLGVVADFIAKREATKQAAF
jgi:uncharacterized protein